MTRDRALPAIIALALALRVAVACWPVIHHPDELWQYLEPAQHIVAGRWIETWDFRDGIRSWLLPLFLAGPMWVGHALAPQTWLGILFARLACTAVSMAGVIASVALAARISRRHALVVAFVGATWFELVYFGPRTAAEPVATGLVLVAIWLLLGGTHRTALAGLLLALACAVRVQYVPAVAVVALAGVRLAPRRWGALIAGGLAGAALSAAADAAMGATPFLWVARSVEINVAHGKAASFGVAPFWWYAKAYAQIWGIGLVPVLWLAAIGARRFPALMAAALVNLAVHSAIAHKEYRFVLLSTTLLLLLAAVGSVDLIERAAVRRRLGRMADRPVALLATGWFVLSIVCAALGDAAATWGTQGRLIAAWQRASVVPGLCGVAVYRPIDPLLSSYALLNRDVPILRFTDADIAAARKSRAFDVWLGPQQYAADLPGYRPRGCDSEQAYCVFARPGGCVSGPADRTHEDNNYLRRHGI